jgi:transcriptional regulator with XRE-family HTH domain
MSKRPPNDTALRYAFIRLLSEVRQKDQRLKEKEIADVLQVKRQTLWLYTKGRATPGGEVIKRACDHWKLKLTVKGFEFTGSAFDTKKKAPQEGLPVQRDLFEVLGTLTSRNLEAKVVGKVGDSFYLQIRIKEAS